MKKTILITGGSGFLGFSLAKKFHQIGYEVFGIGRKSKSTDSELLSSVFDDFIENEISYKALSNLASYKFDAIIHCASNTSISKSLELPKYDYDSSVSSTKELLDFVKMYQKNCLLIFPSSAAVYGEHPDKPIDESSNLNPISPYGKNKLRVEGLLKKYRNICNINIIRFFSIYGPGQKKMLIWDAANKITKNTNVTSFFGHGTETRDFIYIDDAIDLILGLINLKKNFLVINGASGKRTTTREILSLLKKELNPKFKIQFNNQKRKGDPNFFHADISKLGRYGLLPKHELEDGIKKFANWYKSL